MTVGTVRPVLAGVSSPTAVPLPSSASAGLVGHALFVNGLSPLDAPTAEADAGCASDVALPTGD